MDIGGTETHNLVSRGANALGHPPLVKPSLVFGPNGGYFVCVSRPVVRDPLRTRLAGVNVVFVHPKTVDSAQCLDGGTPVIHFRTLVVIVAQVPRHLVCGVYGHVHGPLEVRLVASIIFILDLAHARITRQPQTAEH